MERHQAGVTDRDALLAKQLTLDRRAHGIVDRDAAAQLAGLADHALPRQLISRFAGLERCRGDPRTARDPRELGDLTVGRDAPFGIFRITAFTARNSAWRWEESDDATTDRAYAVTGRRW